MDSDTEIDIWRRLRSSDRKQTRIIITHRLSAVEDVDMIIVLHEGKVIETGTHEQLVENDGIYAALFRCHLIEEELQLNNKPGNEG